MKTSKTTTQDNSVRNHPMAQALTMAKRAAKNGEVPVGAVITHSKTGEIIATATNQTEQDHDPCGHAEIIAIRKACALLKTPRLTDYNLYVTLEPCTMCAAAISMARLKTLYFGAYDPKGGGIEHGARFYNQSTCHHAPEVIGGLFEQDCAQILKDFFQKKR